MQHQWDTLSGECKEAFKKAGIDFDEKPELLPKDVKDLVESNQTGKEATETDVAKQLKQAVGQIRDQNAKKQSLQQKADQAKATYKIYLEELKQINESITQTQQELENLAKSFGSMLKEEPAEEKTPRALGGGTIAMDEDLPVDACHSALASVGVTLTLEQKTQLETVWAEQMRKKRKVGSPRPKGYGG